MFFPKNTKHKSVRKPPVNLKIGLILEVGNDNENHNYKKGHSPTKRQRREDVILAPKEQSKGSWRRVECSGSC